MSTSDPIHSRLAAIREARARVVEACAGVDASDGARRTEGAWALQDVIEHLVLAERGGFDLIWKAAEAHRAGEPVWRDASVNAGQRIEEVVARTFAPRETAPASATPTGDGSLGQWLAHLRSCDALLGALPDHLAGLPLDRIIYPHFLAGPLDALQRLDFIRFHLEHHLPQIVRLREEAQRT